jgi:hypothetical protein
MKRTTKFAATLTFLTVLIAAAPFPAAARNDNDHQGNGHHENDDRNFPPMLGAPGAVFYEVTERMKLINRRGARFRVATSALRGTADRGTPFCPDALLANNPDPRVSSAQFCDLVAIGSDRVNLATGLGTFEATIDMIVPGDNDTDGPELVIGTIKVSGDMDFSPAFAASPLPFGTIKGKVLTRRGRPQLFSGTFRLPFQVGGVLLYLDTLDGQPTGGVIPIQQPGELSLTLPLVRFEVWFE